MQGVNHTLKTFVIDRFEQENMKSAGKTAKVPYADGFVTMNSFNLLQLLARIPVGGN